MRRQIIILLLAVLLVAGGVFAGYPEGYYGDPLPDGCFDVETWITEWYDQEPWGQPDPTGRYFLMGELCVTGGVVDLVLTDLAWRYCHESPWGTVDNDLICAAWYVRPWRAGIHKLGWEEGAAGGFYFGGIWIELEGGEPIFMFDALTWDANENTGRFVQGVWFIEATIFMFDDDRSTRTTWTVRPRQTFYANRLRRSGGRVENMR